MRRGTWVQDWSPSGGGHGRQQTLVVDNVCCVPMYLGLDIFCTVLYTMNGRQKSYHHDMEMSGNINAFL